MRRHAGWLIVLLLALVGCGGGGQDANDSDFSFVSGLGGADTVEAIRATALVVRVRDAAGQPAAGDIVRFEGVPVAAGGAPGVLVSPLNGVTYAPQAVDTADDDGLVRVRVRMGTRAGRWKLAVSVPARLISDTAGFTVLAGALAAVQFQPTDTAVQVGNTVQLRSLAVDRFGNPRTNAVSYSVLAGPGSVTPGGLVSGTATGRVTVSATAGAFGAGGNVSVVPAGTLAAVRLVGLGSIVIFNLDGTGYSNLRDVGSGGFDRGPVWSPDGSEIVFANGDFAPMRLSALDLTGNLRRLIPNPPAGVLEEVYPEYSADGAWIYFNEHGQAGGVWRVHPDGLGAERVSPDTGAQEGQWFPSPSPDGTRYSFFSSTDVGLRTFTIADSSLSTWVMPSGSESRWSPTGGDIAYTVPHEGSVHVVSASGTGDHIVTPAGQLYAANSLSWSPDGAWLAVRGATSIELLQVGTGLRLPLGFTTQMDQPAWRP